jgi:hypothetical protein
MTFKKSSLLMRASSITQFATMLIVPNDRWQEWVTASIKRASFVVIDASTRTGGVQWELETAVALKPPERILVIAGTDAQTAHTIGLPVLSYDLTRKGLASARRELGELASCAVFGSKNAVAELVRKVRWGQAILLFLTLFVFLLVSLQWQPYKLKIFAQFPSRGGLQMAIGRPSFAFVLIDLPSDHEIENNIVRECQVISAILHNRDLGTVTKTITATSVSNFKDADWRPYPGTGFVHLATHGGRSGIGLMEAPCPGRKSLIDWKPSRRNSSQTKNEFYVSLAAIRKTGSIGFNRCSKVILPMRIILRLAKSVATAMTTWSMFYRKKTLGRPLKAVVEPINSFVGRETIVFQEI